MKTIFASSTWWYQRHFLLHYSVPFEENPMQYVVLTIQCQETVCFTGRTGMTPLNRSIFVIQRPPYRCTILSPFRNAKIKTQSLMEEDVKAVNQEGALWKASWRRWHSRGVLRNEQKRGGENDHWGNSEYMRIYLFQLTIPSKSMIIWRFCYLKHETSAGFPEWELIF